MPQSLPDTVHAIRLMGYGSWGMAHGVWLMRHGSRNTSPRQTQDAPSRLAAICLAGQHLQPDPGPAVSLQVLAIAAGALLLAGPVLASAYAAVLPCVSDGEAEGLGSAGLKTSALLSAAGAYLVAEVGMAVGLVLLIVPGVVIGAGLAPLMPLIADRGLGPREALRSAWALTAGHRTRIMGLYALVWLAAFLASGLAYGLALAAPDWAAVAVFLAIGGGVGAWNLMARACLYRQLARPAAAASTQGAGSTGLQAIVVQPSSSRTAGIVEDCGDC